MCFDLQALAMNQKVSYKRKITFNNKDIMCIVIRWQEYTEFVNDDRTTLTTHIGWNSLLTNDCLNIISNSWYFNEWMMDSHGE